MPWISSAEVEEPKDLPKPRFNLKCFVSQGTQNSVRLKIQGHQDSVDQTFKACDGLFRYCPVLQMCQCWCHF